MFAHIIPLTKIPINKPQIYTYKLAELKRDIKIGQVVQIPLYNRSSSGIVVSISKIAEPNITYKAIEKITDAAPIANNNDLRLAEFISDYYFSSLGVILKHALPAIPKRQTKKLTTLLKSIDFTRITALQSKINTKTTKLQTQKIDVAIGTLQQRRKYYEQIINECLKNKQQVLILVPEIMLIPQTINWLQTIFVNEGIVSLHANSNKTDEIINWRKAQGNINKIFIGTRKAIFTSFGNLGHIIIDEEQDLSYKQWDMNPRYDTRAVAKQKAMLYECKLTFGSVAPSVYTYFQIKHKNYNLVALNRQHKKVPLTLIDMRRELHQRNFSIFSDQLFDNLHVCVQEKKQAIILVNRRGLANFIMCRDCGYVARCPNCEVALIEQSGHRLGCNHCSFKSNSPLTCPECTSTRIKSFGIGTERVQQELNTLFPKTHVCRVDLSYKSNLALATKKYNDFYNGKIDILVGTGIAMRLTSPNLKLIAAINIDSTMNFPHFRADEKTWHIIKQISVREDAEQSLIQTYNPDYKLFHTNHFYEQELANRKNLNYPPFCKMIKLICKSDDYILLETESNKVANELQTQLKNIEIIGPVDPINAKIRNFWFKHVYIKIPLNIDFSQENAIIKNIITNLSTHWSVDVDPLN